MCEGLSLLHCSFGVVSVVCFRPEIFSRCSPPHDQRANLLTYICDARTIRPSDQNTTSHEDVCKGYGQMQKVNRGFPPKRTRLVEHVPRQPCCVWSSSRNLSMSSGTPEPDTLARRRTEPSDVHRRLDKRQEASSKLTTRVLSLSTETLPQS